MAVLLFVLPNSFNNIVMCACLDIQPSSLFQKNLFENTDKTKS